MAGPSAPDRDRRDDPSWQRHAALSAVRELLPRGGVLSPATWRRRHRGITALLWLHVLALPIIGVLRGDDVATVAALVGLVALLAIGAGVPGFGVTARSAMSTLGLVCSAAILVLFFDGATEVHFHYFVIVAVVALYQAWWPYLLAVGFVLIEHGAVGTIAPGLVFDMDMSAGQAWSTAAVHGARRDDRGRLATAASSSRRASPP